MTAASKGLFLSCLLGAVGCLAACTPGSVTQVNENNISVKISEELIQAIQGAQKGETATQGSEKPVDSGVEATDEIKTLITTNADALNRKNYQDYFATFHMDSPFKSTLGGIFQQLDQTQVRYQIKHTSVQTQTTSDASVLVSRTTFNVYGQTEEEVLYTLRKEGSDWKVYFLALQFQQVVKVNSSF